MQLPRFNIYFKKDYFYFIYHRHLLLYVIKPHITSRFASELTIAIVFGRGDWKQAVLIAALAALPAVERRSGTRLLSSPGGRGWRGGRGPLVNQYSLCVTRGRSRRGGGKTVTRLSLFKRFVQTLGLRALRKHDLNPGLRRGHRTAACTIHCLFVGGQRDLNTSTMMEVGCPDTPCSRLLWNREGEIWE